MVNCCFGLSQENERRVGGHTTVGLMIRWEKNHTTLRWREPETKLAIQPHTHENKQHSSYSWHKTACPINYHKTQQLKLYRSSNMWVRDLNVYWHRNWECGLELQKPAPHCLYLAWTAVITTCFGQGIYIFYRCLIAIRNMCSYLLRGLEL